MEQTYDADLEVVSWPSEEGLLLRGGGLLGRHCFLFLCGECAGDVEGPAAIERCESRGGEGRTRGRTERASSEDEQPSESISLHRIFTPGDSPGNSRKRRECLRGARNAPRSRLLLRSHGLGSGGMRSFPAQRPTYLCQAPHAEAGLTPHRDSRPALDVHLACTVHNMRPFALVAAVLALCDAFVHAQTVTTIDE